MVDNDDLEPAWTQVKGLDMGGIPSGGCVLLFSRQEGDEETLIAASGSRMHVRLDEYTTDAYITTGFHRLGTLEPKAFEYVRVRVGGNPGSGYIEVSAVLPENEGGGTPWIGDVYPGDNVELRIPGSGPYEALALEFRLHGTLAGDDAPVLLGYQLKALPVPQRQRLIRVPLMMYDHERGPTGRALGAEKSAWTRLQALEALEESNALVTFEDTDTGETGTAYIEQVEVVRRNGSKGVSRSNGFGGVVTVTLRKIA
jgi:hypothetical protein